MSQVVDMPGLIAPYDAFLPGVNRGLGAICQVQFAQDIADMTLYGTNADDQVFGDFLVGESSGDQGEYFDFSLSQFGKKGAPFRFPMAELLDQARRNPGM